MTAKATGFTKFEEAEDDEALLKHIFDQIDTDKNKSISREELSNALRSMTNKELVELLEKRFPGDVAEINFQAFKAGADQVRIFIDTCNVLN
jgi:Ca2+-binding EF-hand superfamily protein